ncbi:MAG: winged helix-turn-helix transcriptional regulator [Planctomycetaceae bacterium]|nr:winged helix-turn-helix transcriptional regulator [Planctomycetaceae bacterium]
MSQDTQLISAAGLRQAAECLKTLAHPSRLHIVQLLLSGKAYTVGELAESCELTQPVTSEHLRLLQRCGFLESQRQGRQVYYQIAEPHLGDLMACIRGRFGQVMDDES